MKELAAGDVIAAKYRLERLVGRGGMGSVWAARHVQLGMPVALKFIETVEGADVADARARFEREARAAGQLRSPHVVQILDHGVDDDRPYIAMELLEGEDLGERFRRDGRLSVPAMAKILGQCAKALRRAHDAGILHRDLKPGNIFLARFDDDEVVKLLDFGVAKVQRAGALDGHQGTQTGIVFGSPSYMSPEQARGVRAIDHRSDLWSLAVIAFRGVTGQKPFQAASIGEMVVKLCIDPLPVATRFTPDLPPEIDAFFARAFARDPAQRFASAPEMAAAFDIVAAGSASGAVPAGSVSLPLPSPSSSQHTALAPTGPTPPPGGSLNSAPPPAPSSATGSGPRVAFAPGTLTPPPGTETVPPPPALARTEPMPPATWGALAPTAGAVSMPPQRSAPSRFDPRPASPAQPSPPGRALLGAGLGGVALGLLLVALLVSTRRGAAGTDGPVAASAPPSAAPVPALQETATTAPEPPAVVTAVTAAPSANANASASASASAAAPPEPPPSASAQPSASAEPETEPTAEPTATPSALPARPKPGKKRRPNFGY